MVNYYSPFAGQHSAMSVVVRGTECERAEEESRRSCRRRSRCCGGAPLFERQCENAKARLQLRAVPTVTRSGSYRAATDNLYLGVQ